MKRLFALLLVGLMLLSLCACGGKNETATNEEPETDAPVTEEPETEATENTTEANEEDNIPSHRLGEEIETDILGITVIRADLAIKLNAKVTGTYEQLQAGQGKISDDYFTAGEYDPEKDAGLAYVARKGHTYIAIEFKAVNLDRSSINFDGPFNGQLMAVIYDNEKYKEDTHYGCKSNNGYEWEKYDSVNVVLLAGEEKYYRCYIDIPTDVNSLDDDFTLLFYLPKSDGTTETFKYQITEEDRTESENQEMSVGEAAYSFNQQEAQDYFIHHLSDYQVLSGDEISRAIHEKTTWDVIIKGSSSSWTGKFSFQNDNRIKETIYNGDSGYFNNRTWRIEGDTIILSNETVCEVRKAADGIYLFTVNGIPYMVIY